MSAVRLAATVILVRPPLEVYLTRRSARSAFAPDAYVFPGGTIEPQDESVELLSRTIGLDADRIAREFRAGVSSELHSSEPAVDERGARALLVAAVRELFEEAGILLACDSAENPIVVDDEQWARIDQQRLALRDGEFNFSQFLESWDWLADARTLTLFSHWITPPSEPRRYNTHFFLARAPQNQSARADADETHDGVWLAPQRALSLYRSGELHLVYPTIKHLERLAPFTSVEEAVSYAAAKPVVTIMPNDDGADFAIPPALEDAW